MGKPSTIENELHQLRDSIRRHIFSLCVLFIVFLLCQAITYLNELVVLFAGVSFSCYLLLGPINLLEKGFQFIFPEGFRERFLPEPIQKWPIPGINLRLLSVVLVFTAFVFVLVVGTGRILPEVTVQVTGFAKELPGYYAEVQKRLDALSKMTFSETLMQLNNDAGAAQPDDSKPGSIPSLPDNFDQPGAHSDSNLPLSESALGQLVLFFHQIATSAFTNVLDFVTTSLTGLVYALTGLVLLFYFLLDGTALRNGFVGLMPSSARSSIGNYLDFTHFLFYNLIKVQVLTAFLSGLMLYGVYSLLGVEFAGFLSFFFALCSVVPAIGPWVGAIPSVLVLLFSGEPVSMVVIFSLLGGFYVFKQQWLIPKVFGGKLDINPILIILTLLACTQLIGPLGFLLAIPIACLIAAAVNLAYPPEKAMSS